MFLGAWFMFFYTGCISN